MKGILLYLDMKGDLSMLFMKLNGETILFHFMKQLGHLIGVKMLQWAELSYATTGY